MKTAQDIASKVVNSSRFHKTPVGVAQGIILDALGIKAENFGHANAIFKALGITVIPKRQGRRSVPQVVVNDLSGGAFSRYDGSGEAWDYSPDVDLTAIQEWMIGEGHENHNQ